MTAPPASARNLERILTPARLAIGLVIMLVIALVREPASSPNSAWRFTSYSADPNGARGLYEIVQTLGWNASRRTTGFRGELEPKATYLVLDPAIDLTATEVGNLLAAVRKGAGLVVVPRKGTRLADSLPVWASGAGSAFSPILLPLDTSYRTPPSAVVSQTHLWPRAVLRSKRPLRDDTVVFLAAAPPQFSRRPTGKPMPGAGPVVLGLPFDKGRIVAIADPTFLRNDVLRHGNTSVLAARALEYARQDSALTLIFDEFHHGFGTHANVLGSIGRFLGTTAPGLALLQLAIAGIILLAAFGPRPLPPGRREREERRSALEHVDALAAAYEGAAAGSTAARRLVRGLRRRHPVGSASTLGEVEYLSLLRSRRPALARDAALLADACESGIVPARLGELLAATDRIDQSLHAR